MAYKNINSLLFNKPAVSLSHLREMDDIFKTIYPSADDRAERHGIGARAAKKKSAT